jgi:hypothetical protein
MLPEHRGDTSESMWMECIACGNTEQFDLMIQERLVDSPLRRDRDALRAEVAKLTAELERWKAPLTVDQIGSVCAIADIDWTSRVHSLDLVIRAVREAGDQP